MSVARNKVIAGDYNGKMVSASLGAVHIGVFGGATLNAQTVDSYEIVTDEHRKSAASGVGRGIVGGALLGPVGLLAGALSATNVSIYIIAIQFTNGKKSLIEVDDKIYKTLVTACFNKPQNTFNTSVDYALLTTQEAPYTDMIFLLRNNVLCHITHPDVFAEMQLDPNRVRRTNAREIDSFVRGDSIYTRSYLEEQERLNQLQSMQNLLTEQLPENNKTVLNDNEMIKLQNLFDSGIITEDEFNAASENHLHYKNIMTGKPIY